MSYTFNPFTGKLDYFKPPATPVEYSIGNSGTSITINWNNGLTNASTSFQYITMTANCTFTFTAPSVTGVVILCLRLIQDGSGNHTATWPGAIKWQDAQPIILTKAAASVDLVFFRYDSGTGNYYVTGFQTNLS